jgi:hypothetical protein
MNILTKFGDIKNIFSQNGENSPQKKNPLKILILSRRLRRFASLPLYLRGGKSLLR